MLIMGMVVTSAFQIGSVRGQAPPRAKNSAVLQAVSGETSSNLSSATHDPSSTVVSKPMKQAAAWKSEAVEAAQEIVKNYPKSAISYALLGSAYFNIGQSSEAVENLKHCIELDSSQTDAYEILARVSYDKGELEEAVRLCEQGLKNGGINLLILHRLGQSLLDLGRAKAAIGILEKTVKLPGHNSKSFYLLGQSYLQTGNHSAAKKNFQSAIKLTPDHTQAFFGLFMACMRLEQTESAKQYREQFLKLEAIDRRALTDRSGQEDTLSGLPMVRETAGRTFFGAGQINRYYKQNRKAEKLFLKAAIIDPEQIQSRAALEDLLMRRKALPEAVSIFKKLTAEQPNSSLNHLFLGKIYYRLQQFEPAEKAFLKVLELAPERPDGYRALIELYLKSNREPIEARNLAERLLELEPESGPNLYLLAFSRIRNNDRPGAVEAMEQAVILSPGNKRFQTFLQQLKKAP